ncbi:hypothetical protein G6K91_21850 [Agrobacterium rhizogenes]|nr:hypothetical protein [Rhizobium rhizogenes]NTG58201.1 hypothetical protein [Rhizobium rhizogenes]NTH03826.1 hypothetical protein [Rhizobium rhizogenes]NTI59547.1 hypothetical protein [Rhizobium rhizogenes]
MTAFGTADEWADLIDSFLPKIMDLVVTTWATMPALTSDAREDPTTESFCRRLRQSRTAQELPLRIDTQMVELNSGSEEDQGRMDIAFSPMVPSEEIYFCLECKRLNAETARGIRSYASEYISHGMLRFIRGQYAGKVRSGAMVGYVLDGNLNGAIETVTAAIIRRHADLGMAAPATILASAIMPNNLTFKETHHIRPANSSRFVIHHLFVTGAP